MTHRLELLESVRTRWQDSNYRSSLYYQLARVLAALGIAAGDPQIRNRNDPKLARQARMAGVSPAWGVSVERWEATSTLTPRSRGHTRDAILKAGRWLQDVHPHVTRADQWTRELAAHYVATVSRMKVGDYVSRTTAIAGVLGKPVSARTQDRYLGAMRRFFADIQEWEWTPRRFDPARAFATPRSIKMLIGPTPRTIADDLWAKLLWAGLNPTVADVKGHSSAPRSYRGASGATLRNGSYYPIEMLRALSLVWLSAGLRSNEIVRRRLGCARQEPSSPDDASPHWLLDARA